MQHKKKFLLLPVLILLSVFLPAGCSEKKESVQVTVVNRTDYDVADIRISPAGDESWGDNRIKTVLEEGDQAEIYLGEFTEKELTESGFHIQFYDEDGDPVNPYYDANNPIFFDSGDYLILAPPDISTAIFIDTGYDTAKYDQKIFEAR